MDGWHRLYLYLVLFKQHVITISTTHFRESQNRTISTVHQKWCQQTKRTEPIRHANDDDVEMI